MYIVLIVKEIDSTFSIYQTLQISLVRKLYKILI